MDTPILSSGGSNSSGSYESISIGMSAVSHALSSGVEGTTNQPPAENDINVTVLVTATTAENIANPVEQEQQEGVPSIANHPSGVSRPINRGEDSCFKCCAVGCAGVALIFGPPMLGIGIGSACCGNDGLLYGALIGVLGGICGSVVFGCISKVIIDRRYGFS
jgi:hypothetical protein